MSPPQIIPGSGLAPRRYRNYDTIFTIFDTSFSSGTCIAPCILMMLYSLLHLFIFFTYTVHCTL